MPTLVFFFGSKPIVFCRREWQQCISVVDTVMADSGTYARTFTQHQINTCQVLYEFTHDPSSWFSHDSSQQRWLQHNDSFELTVSAAGADTISHKSVVVLK